MLLVLFLIFLCTISYVIFWFIELKCLSDTRCRFQLKQEQENRRNATMMYNTTRDKLRRTEEQQQFEVQERQKVELTLRNLELEMRTMVNNMKQVHPLKLHLFFCPKCAVILLMLFLLYRCCRFWNSWQYGEMLLSILSLAACEYYISGLYVNLSAWRGPQWDPEAAGPGAQCSDAAGESAQQPSP